jgi:hypothetical protein
MPRPRFSLKTLLWLMAVVGLFCGSLWLAVQINHKSPSKPSDSADMDLPAHLLVRNPGEAIQESFARSNAIRFLSWNGRWIGTDLDTEIKLMSDGTVELTEYGVGVDTYAGTYSINENSELSLSLVGYATGWPTMRVYRDHSALLLAPADASGRVTRIGSRWPFRQVVD